MLMLRLHGVLFCCAGEVQLHAQRRGLQRGNRTLISNMPSSGIRQLIIDESRGSSISPPRCRDCGAPTADESRPCPVHIPIPIPVPYPCPWCPHPLPVRSRQRGHTRQAFS